ncbi:MAG TPA: Lrp/AsnC family transcriptional regulator [Thermoplasmatales archaeon]|nr:Lrp/AsnC family transcriptional regulator [Thermoplasmatales archaeon]
MIKAYILIRARVGKLDNILREAKKLKNVENIAVLAGDHDIIIKAKVKEMEDLMKLTDEIQMIDGIKQTTTQVVEKEINL